MIQELTKRQEQEQLRAYSIKELFERGYKRLAFRKACPFNKVSIEAEGAFLPKGWLKGLILQ